MNALPIVEFPASAMRLCPGCINYFLNNILCSYEYPFTNLEVLNKLPYYRKLILLYNPNTFQINNIAIKNKTPWRLEKKFLFAELGKMLNSIRSISTELNEEIKIDTREHSIARLQANFQQLESEIAYFFTATGSWKTLDNLFNTQLLRQKFVEKFEALVHELFQYQV
jgi:hypothetical protein